MVMVVMMFGVMVLRCLGHIERNSEPLEMAKMSFLYPFNICRICVRRSILSKTAELLGFSVNFRTVCANASSLLSRQDIADQSTRFTSSLMPRKQCEAEISLSKMDRKKAISKHYHETAVANS